MKVKLGVWKTTGLPLLAQVLWAQPS